MSWWKIIFGTPHKNGVANSHTQTRWVVLDCESTGLNPLKDRLLSISAIALELQPSGALSIHYDDTFEVILNHGNRAQSDAMKRGAVTQSTKDNVLIHGIGLGAQYQGLPPEAAMQAFAQFAADSPLIAFHAGFDQALLGKAMQDFQKTKLSNPWLDLEHACAVLYQEHRRLALDNWLTRYGIVCAKRHNASADTLASAELLTALWSKLQTQKNVSDWQGLVRFAKDVKHLAGRS